MFRYISKLVSSALTNRRKKWLVWGVFERCQPMVLWLLSPSGKPPPDRSLITRVKRAKNWGFCSDKCRIDSRSNILKETQLTILSAHDCAGFNTSVLSYRQDGELCAGNKKPYPMMKVYIRKKLRRPIDGRKYTFIPAKDKINTVNTLLIFCNNGVKSYLKEHSFYFIASASAHLG